MLKRYTLLCIVLCLWAKLVTAGQTDQNMRLEQCLQIGLRNNPTFKASQLKAAAAGQDINIARSDFFPSLTSTFSANQITSNAAEGPTDSDYLDQAMYSVNVRLVQILYAGSRIVNTYDKAQLLEQAATAEQELARLELAYNIETTFYKVMKAKQDVIVSEEAVQRLQENVRAAKSFVAKELAPQVDLLTAEVDLADAENQLGVARNNENRQKATLFALMNLPMDTQVQFVDNGFKEAVQTPEFKNCYEYALEHRPDLLTLKYQREAAIKDGKIALGKYLPVVQVEAGYYDQKRDYDALGSTGAYTYDRDQRNAYWMVGLSVSWNLFDGGRSWYGNEKAALDARRFRELQEEANNTIGTGIRKALYSIAEAKQRLQGSNGALTAARENYAAEDNRLKAGVSTISALLDAQSRLVRAQANQSAATLDYQLAQSELKFMTGSKKSW